MRRTPYGWEELSWDEAYREVAKRLREVRESYGNDAIGMYTGNPVVHDLGALLYRPVLQRALASRNSFNASAIDTLPKIVQTGLMFGRHFPTGVPVPDIDRTHYLLVIGANPVVSHGSLMTMPDAPGRLKAVVKRGGKLVVIDPRRTETAKIASEHHFIRPASDAAFLLALVYTLFEEGLVDLGAAAGRLDRSGRFERLKIRARSAPPAWPPGPHSQAGRSPTIFLARSSASFSRERPSSPPRISSLCCPSVGGGVRFQRVPGLPQPKGRPG